MQMKNKEWLSVRSCGYINYNDNMVNGIGIKMPDNSFKI